MARRKPPSRLKYEREHPAISFRVSKEFFAQLQILRYQTGKSYSDFLKVGIGIMEPDIGEAWFRGFEDAKEDYCITYQCTGCHKKLEVESSEEKEFCRQALIEAGWGHKSCHSKAEGMEL